MNERKENGAEKEKEMVQKIEREKKEIKRSIKKKWCYKRNVTKTWQQNEWNKNGYKYKRESIFQNNKKMGKYQNKSWKKENKTKWKIKIWKG